MRRPKKMAAIKVGSSVLCIDDSGFAPTHGETMPVAQHTYTVRQILTSGAQKCFRLREIVNAPALYAPEGSPAVECSFRANRFIRKP